MPVLPSPDPFVPDSHVLDQHLLDPAVARSLVDAIPLSSADLVLDLGAGTGVLTEAIVGRRPGGVIAVEPDPRCRPFLAGLPGVEVRPVRIQQLAADELAAATMIIANPPFSVLQHVIALARDLPRLRAVYLCAGARWAAAPADDHFSIVSLEVSAAFTPVVLGAIPGSAFTPPITSAAAWLHLLPRLERDPVIMLLAEAVRHRGGLRLKDLLRSPRLSHGPSADRLRLLRADPTLRRLQQRRLASLTRLELATLTARIRHLAR